MFAVASQVTAVRPTATLNAHKQQAVRPNASGFRPLAGKVISRSGNVSTKAFVSANHNTKLEMSSNSFAKASSNKFVNAIGGKSSFSGMFKPAYQGVMGIGRSYNFAINSIPKTAGEFAIPEGDKLVNIMKRS